MSQQDNLEEKEALTKNSSRIFKVTLDIDNDESRDDDRDSGALSDSEAPLKPRFKFERRRDSQPLGRLSPKLSGIPLDKTRSMGYINPLNDFILDVNLDPAGFNVCILSTDIEPDVSVPYTLYICQIEYEGVGWLVSRRYRQFRHLHRKLKEDYEFARIFEFPRKSFWKMRGKVIKRRKAGFEKYLREAIDNAMDSIDLQEFLEVDKRLKVSGFEDSLTVDDFENIELLGKGGSGEVYLSRLKRTGEILAVKRVPKSELYKRNEISYAETEHDVLVLTSQEKSIVGLLYTFQDENNVFFAMEWCCGGDIRTYMYNMGFMDEEVSRFYMAEMVDSVNTLHRLGYIHRDLKPENFLIDKKGHIKLIDFGLSTRGCVKETSKQNEEDLANIVGKVEINSNMNSESVKEELNEPEEHSSVDLRAFGYSVVGSPLYMAPEIILQEGYSSNVDWWSLGCILYEMLANKPTFFANNKEEVLKIIPKFKETLKYPTYFDILYDTDGELAAEYAFSSEEDEKREFSDVSDSDSDATQKYSPIHAVGPEMDDEELKDLGPISPLAWDLITKLICEKENRLDYQKIKSHPYFEGVDWERIRSSTPPFVPQLKSETDTFYFKRYKIAEKS